VAARASIRLGPENRDHAGGGERRSVLGADVNILLEDIAQSVLHFASPARSAKSTGNLLNVDGGVAAAYPR
jgi:hypothetical protein